MIADLLRSLLAPAPPRLPEPDARLALAALLVRVARTDGLYAAEEVERIEAVLIRRHGLSPFEAAHLRSEAEDLDAAAPDTVRFTRALKAAVDLPDRAALLVPDTIPLRDGAAASPRIRQLSVAGIMAETIRRISNDDSVSSLFID